MTRRNVTLACSLTLSLWAGDGCGRTPLSTDGVNLLGVNPLRPDSGGAGGAPPEMDAGPDADGNAGSPGIAGSGDVGGAGGGTSQPFLRLLAPLSTATVTSQTPTLHWVLPEGADGASIELFSDRACTHLLTSFTAQGTSGKPASALEAGVVFWRGTALRGGQPFAATSPVWQLVVGHRSAPNDTSWGTVPDVNGDGYADLLVGAPGLDEAPGSVYVYLGAPGGPIAAPTYILTTASPGTGFGSAVASAGDVNGDGFADVVVGGNGVHAAGEVFLFLGGPGGVASAPASDFTGNATGNEFGFSVASAGDVNGDGYADVIVGALEAVTGPGQAFLYLGGPTGLSGTPANLPLIGANTDDAFGSSVTGVGDMNGDGYGDVVIGAYEVNEGAGAAYVYLGSANGLQTTPALVVHGVSSDDKFGVATSCAGDVNGDGLSDLLVGAFQTETGPGLAYLYLGSATALSPDPFVTLQGPQPGDNFAVTLSGTGDVNGDGYSDAIIGAQGFVPFGAAFVYFGGKDGYSATPGVTLTGDSEVFGVAVAIAGDVDRDGFDDVIVGNSDLQQNTGAAFLYLGSPGGPKTPTSYELDGIEPNDLLGSAVAMVCEPERSSDLK